MMEQVSALPLRNNSDLEDVLPWPYVISKRDFQNTVFAILGMIIFIGTIGNTLTLSVIVFYRNLLSKPFNILAVLMIVADLITCSVGAPLLMSLIIIYARNNVFSNTLCLISLFVNNLCKTTSLITMSETAILRAIHLSNKTRANMSKTTILKIIVINIIVVPLWAAVRSFTFADICDGIQSQSLEPQIGPAVEWCSAVIIIASCYCGIACYVKTRAGKIARQRNARAVRYDIATIRTCIIIIVAFFLSHIPFVVYAVLSNMHILPIDLVEVLFFLQLSFLSQAGNPIIMFATCKELRKHMCMFVRQFSRKRAEVPAVVDLPDIGNGGNRR